MTRNGDYTDEKGNVIIAAPVGMTEAEEMSRDNDLESLEFLYGAYGRLVIFHLHSYYHFL